jgi:hypothetical protein
MLALRRTLAAICYTAMLAADAAEVYIIYKSIYGSITYHFGLALFVPIFIFTYWMSTFFMQLTAGKVGEKRIMAKKLRFVLNLFGNIISILLIGFWGYIYISQTMSGSTADVATE